MEEKRRWKEEARVKLLRFKGRKCTCFDYTWIQRWETVRCVLCVSGHLHLRSEGEGHWSQAETSHQWLERPELPVLQLQVSRRAAAQGSVLCSTWRYNVMRCNTVWYNTIQCNAVLLQYSARSYYVTIVQIYKGIQRSVDNMRNQWYCALVNNSIHKFIHTKSSVVFCLHKLAYDRDWWTKTNRTLTKTFEIRTPSEQSLLYNGNEVD